MICVFDKDNLNFEGNGNAVLLPTEAKVRSVAGGNYDLTMVHPMDPEGKWRHLVPGAIVRVPIPEEEIENAFSGYEADVYKTTEEAALREGPNEPTTITYPTWAVGNSYAIGTKVTFLNKNYECTYWDAGSGFIYLDPAHSSWWKEIARYTSGSAVLVTLPAGSELYFVQDYDSTWYKMSTYYGVEGYIKKSQVTFYKHLSQDETKPRIIREQLFRITNATADTKSHVVNVTAQHVSYDLNGIIVQDVSIKQASPAMAIGRMVEGFMIPYDGTIATNLTSDDNGTYTDDIKGKTGMYCFLDPDKGIVGKFDAALKRDNWDLFILQKTNTNRGFSIRYRKNMLGVSWARKSDGLITRVVPVAKDEKGDALYLPEKWIDSDYINDYPVIRMERLSMKEQVGKDKGTGDGSTWTLSDLYDEMRAKAAERFTVDKVDRIVDEVTVDFEQLGDTDEHAALKGFEKVLLYDAVTVIHEEIGLNMVMTVNELEWDAIRQKITSVKVSNVGNRAGRSVTGYNVQNKSIGWQKLTDDVSDDIISQMRDIIPEYADPTSPRPAIPVINSKTEDGYVLKGGSNANKVWKTDDQGNPGWRDEATVSGYIPESEKGAANGVATLDSGGKVPSNQLPSYVDDVLEYANKASFPVTGEAGKIYVAKDTGKTYRWSGSAYVELSSYDEATSSSSGLMSASDKTKLDGIEAQANKYVLPQATSSALGGIKIGWTGSGKDYPVELDSNGKAHVAVPWTDTTYTLPLAASGTRGGIQIGYSESGKKYAVKLDSEKAYVEVPWTADGGNAATVNGKTVAVNVPADAKFTDHEYTAGTGLSLSNGQFAVRLAYSTSGKNYKVQADNSGNLYVNVPWENTVYSLPLAANGTRGGIQIGYTQSGKNYPVQLSSEKAYVNVPWTADGGAAATAVSFASAKSVELTGDTTGSASSTGGWSISTTTDQLTYKSQITSLTALDSFGVDSNVRIRVARISRISGTGYGENDGMIISVPWSSQYGHQFFVDDSGYELWHRYLGGGTWTDWKKILDSSRLAYPTSGKNYGIRMDGDGLYVSVPWTDESGNNRVLRAGDTMTGNLGVHKASDCYVYVKETGTGQTLYLNAATNYQGLYSNGYYNGSSFVSSGKWIVNRGSNGITVFDGDLTGNAATATQLGDSIRVTSVEGSTSTTTGQGWKQVALLNGYKTGRNFLVNIRSSYNSPHDQETLLAISLGYNSASISVISSTSNNDQYTKARLRRVTTNTSNMYLDLYYNPSSTYENSPRVDIVQFDPGNYVTVYPNFTTPEYNDKVSCELWFDEANLVAKRIKGEDWVSVKNQTTTATLTMKSQSNGDHGISSNGYWDGSFHSSDKWILFRSTDGNTNSVGQWVSQGKLIAFNTGQGSSYYTGGIELREYNRSGSSLEDTLANAPGITFHWGSVTVGKFHMRKDGNLYWASDRITTKIVESSYRIPPTKGVRITYPSSCPVLISIQRTNTEGQLLLVGGGYGAEGWVRNQFITLVDSASFTWSLPESSSISRSIEIMNPSSNGNADVIVWTDGSCTFTEITALSSAVNSRKVLHSNNYQTYAVARTGDTTTGNFTNTGNITNTGYFTNNGSVLVYPASNAPAGTGGKITAFNTTRGFNIALQASSGGGSLSSTGYWNGSAYVESSLTILERSTDGKAYFHGDADTVDGYHESSFVKKSGDTMTDKLTLQKASEVYLEAKNTGTGISVLLDTGSSGNHGIYTRGYYNGSTFTSDPKWMIYRGTDGRTYVDGMTWKSITPTAKSGYVFANDTSYANVYEIALSGYFSATGGNPISKITSATVIGQLPSGVTPKNMISVIVGLSDGSSFVGTAYITIRTSGEIVVSGMSTNGHIMLRLPLIARA